MPSAPRTKPPQPPQVGGAGDDHRAGAVAEEHGGPAVVVVGEARQRLGAADEHDARSAGLDQRGGLVQRVEEAGARGVDVDRRGAVGADARATSGARPGVTRSGVIVETMTWSTSAAVAPGVRQRAAQAWAASGASGSSGGEVAALADARAPHDPLVRRVEPRRELGVGDDALGQRRADAEEPACRPRRRAGVRRGARAAAGAPPGRSPGRLDVAEAITRPPASA